MSIKLKTFTLRKDNGCWLGQIIISSDGMFSAVTDYGNLSFAWRAVDEDFRKFLMRIEVDYFSSKLINGLSYIVYNAKTVKACERFAEEILPTLKKALENDLINDERCFYS